MWYMVCNGSALGAAVTHSQKLGHELVWEPLERSPFGYRNEIRDVQGGAELPGRTPAYEF